MEDSFAFIGIDSNRQALLICGITNSPNLATPNATDTVISGLYSDVLVASINFGNITSRLYLQFRITILATPNWVTYFGGSGVEMSFTCNSDLNGNFYVAGLSYSSDYQLFNNFESLTMDSDGFAFIFILDAQGGIRINFEY